MQLITDLALILKTFPYGERDRVTILLTENHGLMTALAKGAIHSRRYGGSLGFLTVSQVRYVQKPHVEMSRLDEATVHHEFKQLSQDYDRMTLASFFAEFSLRILEPQAPSREFFVILTNALYQLDAGFEIPLVCNVFLSKMLWVLGYSPNLLTCAQCTQSASEILKQKIAPNVAGDTDFFYWSKTVGGMVCSHCIDGQKGTPLLPQTIQLFHHLVSTSFKEMKWQAADPHAQLQILLMDFMHYHVPQLALEKMNTLAALTESLSRVFENKLYSVL